MESYGDGVRRFLTWADGEGRPAVLDRAGVNAFSADLLEAAANRPPPSVTSIGVTGSPCQPARVSTRSSPSTRKPVRAR